MAEPTRIRASFKDGVTDVRMRMTHEMESGQRKDAAGRVVPAWHIAEVTVAVNAKPVLTMHWGPSVSRNPYVRLKLTSARPGDRLSVAWVDSRGERRADEVVVG